MAAPRTALVIAVALLGGCANGDGSESVGDKSEWALLQGLELENRGQVPSGPVLSSLQQYDFLAVPSLDRKVRICVMLWPKSPPFYKQMPDGNFEISRELLLRLRAEHKVSSTVANALGSHVQNGT